jgi:hypothetical protein
MIEAAFLQGLFKLSLALIGLIMARLCAGWMDKYLVPPEFETWLKGSGDEARALYYGLRMLALCLLVGLSLS